MESMNYNYIEMKKCSKKRITGIVKRIASQMDSQSVTSYSKITKFRRLYLKHKQKIRGLMWKSLIIKGFFIVMEGVVEMENDKNWRYHLTPGDFFGENLMFKVKALSNFGRMVAASPVVKLLFFPREKFN